MMGAAALFAFNQMLIYHGTSLTLSNLTITLHPLSIPPQALLTSLYNDYLYSLENVPYGVFSSFLCIRET